ncbi:MAG TPA: extracellular solute-binding protein, partial [Paenibacillus sp.]|nr:extracellular solute-binding protein [Paenibacillus sp.]
MRHTAAFRKRTGWNVLLALGLALFLALGACSGDGGGSSDAGRGRVSSMVLDRGAISPEEGTYADNRYTRWINENGPVDVTFVPIPRAEAVNKLNVLLASGDAPDVLAEYDTAWLGEMANQRQLLPLDELIEAHGPEYKRLLERYPMLRKLGTMEDGKLYLIGSVSRKSNSYGIFIRQDWLERLGL